MDLLGEYRLVNYQKRDTFAVLKRAPSTLNVTHLAVTSLVLN